ncbi:unnamed protein product [Phytophthora lilii]|uniref:Unnamed protein product n=1 Tax=Phytophthora lilii TaxID=2077276 RepID=A0A9W6TE59_9STRA|nr:unnamed protein product [Phytophthora lilii]
MATASRAISPTVGRKRRIDGESAPQTPVRRRRVGTSRVRQSEEIKPVAKDDKCKKQEGKKPGTLLLSSPTDVADLPLLKVQVRTKQAKASRLPDLSPPSLAKADDQEEEVSEVEAEVELTPRPMVLRRSAQRPPLSRRRVVSTNRAKLGVGIVRCRSWRLSGEETETEEEDESPPPSPRRTNSSRSRQANEPVLAMEPPGCECSRDSSAEDERPEDYIGASVLPIDPSQMCFDRSFSEDEWQIRSPSPDEEFVPETSCCANMSGKITLKNEEGHRECKPKPVRAEAS